MIAPAFASDDVADAIRARRVDRWLEKAGIAVVHLGLIDASGVLREKRLSAAAAVRAFEDGWTFIDAIDWWDPADGLWRTGGSMEQPALVDTASGRPYPFEPEAALFLADFTGPLSEFSPRAQLSRMVQRAQELGVRAEVGWEFECIVLAGPSTAAAEHFTAPQPVMMANRCWSAHTPASHALMLRDLEALLAAGSVPLDHCCSELGPGCLELATAHADAGRSADEALLAKVYSKAFFEQRGQTAAFMAQLADDVPGLGGHPTLTLHSADGGRPLLQMEGDALGSHARSAVGGVVALLPDLFPMVAATPNSYRRFAPGNWSPAAASWGVGNYSCALRVVRGPHDQVRLELRAPGADVSPHLCLAMFLGAVVWGIEQKLEPPPPIDPPADGRSAAGSVRFPRTLAEAVDRFAASDAAEDLFGSAFVSHHAGACRAEDEACRRMVPVGERRRYLLQA